MIQFETDSSEGPLRTHIRVFENTRDAAEKKARSIRAGLAELLDADSHSFPETYQGFSHSRSKHEARVTITYGLNQDAARETVESYVASLQTGGALPVSV